MKIKPQYLALIAILFVGGVFGVLFMSSGNLGYLFSRSVDGVTDAGVVEEGAEPKPIVESLDGESSSDASGQQDIQAMIQSLQTELLQVENDPDRALEIRRRIQLLKEQYVSATTVEVSNSLE